MRGWNRIIQMEWVGYNLSGYISYFLGRKNPACNNHPCLVLNIPVTCMFLSHEIHHFQCLPRKSHKSCAMFMWSYINVTSWNGSLRLPIHAVPPVTSVREGSVGANQAMHPPAGDPRCVCCHLTSPEAPVHIALFAFENRRWLYMGI